MTRKSKIAKLRRQHVQVDTEMSLLSLIMDSLSGGEPVSSIANQLHRVMDVCTEMLETCNEAET